MNQRLALPDSLRPSSTIFLLYSPKTKVIQKIFLSRNVDKTDNGKNCLGKFDNRSFSSSSRILAEVLLLFFSRAISFTSFILTLFFIFIFYLFI